jgi:glutamyl-tRNA reductase
MILLTGLNHRTTPVEVRERCYLSTEQLPLMLYQMRQLPDVQGVVVLSTCNRLEVYTVIDERGWAISSVIDTICAFYGMEPFEIEPYLYVEQDTRAITHLMRVAAGLDSMILGEAQILGQVKSALAAADLAGVAGATLHRLFEVAAHTGKRARTETPIDEQTTSISHAAARLLMNRVESSQSEVLVIGTGEMAALAAQALADRQYTNLHIVNRTYAHGADLAQQVGASAYEWSCLWDRLASADAVITATGAPHPVLYLDDMRRVVALRDGKPLVMIDIAVPRDIDDAVQTLDEVVLYDIDELQNVVDENLAQRKAAVPLVEKIIKAEVAKFSDWLHERKVTPVIRDLRREVQQVVQAELDAALSKLEHLGEAERKIMERMAHRIVNKVLHTPTISLRAHAANGNADDYAEMVRDLFDLLPEVS